ncbi:hypothetical protein OIV36_28055 [Burkholderia pseudomallei]|uniref:hypothetical protein n=1 Tax=Burkholderia pseudomallei TaxID=28450 RepID=UPI0021F7013C|nr:hypothetical protein [Burkholderia pseudomallei]MCW0053334.1 hypothetical protein [Burkholderia pseudomallei]
MSYPATVYKVMIASPSDVASERKIIRDILSEWNAVHSEKRSIVLLPVGWETHASPEMGDHPQSLINEQMATSCDLLIGVFWTRVGTPTETYDSGSVEEIEKHIAAGKIAMLYFSAAPVELDSVDQEQYSKLKDFKASCKTRGLFEAYTDIGDFREKFYRQIQLKLNQHAYFNQASLDAQVLEPIAPPTPSLPKLTKLTKEAAFMLKSAAENDGTITHLQHLGGCMIQTNDTNFVEDQSPRNIAIWEGAIGELESFGLIQATSAKRQMFRVTRDGYEMAEVVNP